MHWKISSYIQDCFTNKAKRRKAIAVLSVLSVLVVSVVALQLMQPAITMSSELICVLEEHSHSENCYAVHQICELQESEEHVHAEACYSRAMVCGKEAHTHGGECYAQVIEETLAPTEVPVTEVPVTEVPVTEVPVTEVPVTEVPVTEVPVTEEPEATEEVVITEAPAETETPVPLTVTITSEKDLGIVVNETATWQLNTTGAVTLSYNVTDVTNGAVVVPETSLDPTTTSLSWTTSIPGVYHITFTVSDGAYNVSDTASLAVSDGNMVLGLTTDALYASPANSPIYHISQSGGTAPVKYQVSVLQDETEILSLTDYEQNTFTVAVQSWEKKSTITVNVKAVDANGVTAETSATLRCSGTLVETPAEWRSAFKGLELTGEWPKDLLMIAETQMGYAESQDNFVIESDGFYGYTRYGDWWHLPYSDWCAMFVSFCMDNAELPEDVFPQESNATRMRRDYASIGLFAKAGGDFIPSSGDLVFFDWDGDGKANHVGIVYDVSGSKVITIEGNHDAEVGKHEYKLNDPTIVGYGLINMAYEAMLEATSTEEPVESTVTPEGETSYYMCEVSEHVHGDECIDEVGNVICEVTEHVHTEECLVAPETTEEVIETEEPVVTEEVVETEEPVATEEVVETEEPVATEEPAETEEPVVEPTYYCGLEEHAHVEACIDAEGNVICEVAEHTHTEECTVAPVETEEPVVEPTYYCGLEEHAHVETCFDAEGNLICEVAEHAHIEECTVAPEVTEEPVVEPTYYCGLEEHAHIETCFDAEGNLICEVAEHAHTEECTVAPEVTEEPVVEPTYYCGLEEHAHIETCFDAEGNLICEVAEHAHTEECLVEVVLYCAMEEHLHAEECYDEFGTLICQLEEHLHSDVCTKPQPTRYVYQDYYVYITIEIPEGVTLPFGSELVVTPVDKNSQLYSDTVDQAKTVTGKKSVEDLVYDICFMLNGVEVEPEGGEIIVRFHLAEDVLNSQDLLPEEFDINVVHMVDENTPELLENNALIHDDGTVQTVEFSTDSFSTYYVSVNLAGDIDPGTYRGKTFEYNDEYNAFVNNSEYSKYIVHTSPLGIAGSFHLVAFDTANVLAHCNGNILALNCVAQSNFGTNQLADELSYILNYKEINGGSGAKANHVLVVGSGHTIGLKDNGTALSINNVKMERPNKIIKDRDSNNRPFIDLEWVENQIRSISDNLYNQIDGLDWDKIITYNYWGSPSTFTPGTRAMGADVAVAQNGYWYTSPNGGFYMNPTINVNKIDGAAYVEMKPDTINGIERRLELTGFKKGHNGSLIINVDCSLMEGKTINLPPTMLYIDGKQTAASETGEFSNGKVIWNFTHAEGVTINTDTMVGSIIAPGATVNIKSNINGTVIADVINVKAESHRTDFTGTTRPSTIKDGFKKQVNGGVPKATENFVFIKEKWNPETNEWKEVGRAVNYGGEFHFSDITYTDANASTKGETYWYRVYEATEQPNLPAGSMYEISKVQYLVKDFVKLKPIPGMFCQMYQVEVKSSFYRLEDNNSNIDFTKLGKPIGAKDLIFNNIYVPNVTPTPAPTPTNPDAPTPSSTPESTPTPTPVPAKASISFNFQKTVNGNPADGNQKFSFEFEELVFHEEGNWEGKPIETLTNVSENLATSKFGTKTIEYPHKNENAETPTVTTTYWYRAYEQQSQEELDKTYEYSTNQYFIRVMVEDNYIYGTSIVATDYYVASGATYDGKLIDVPFVPEYDETDEEAPVLIGYIIDETVATYLGDGSGMVFNNNEKNRDPIPVNMGIDLYKNLDGQPVKGAAEDGTFPAFNFVLEKLTHQETPTGISSGWEKVDSTRNTNNQYTSTEDLIHFELDYAFETDIGVHWYRVYEDGTAAKKHTVSNGAVTESEEAYNFNGKNLVNSKDVYYIRVEVTMDEDYNLSASSEYFLHSNAIGTDNNNNRQIPEPSYKANGTEVDTSSMSTNGDHIFHNELQDVAAIALVDPGAYYKQFGGNPINNADQTDKYTFIMEQLIGSNWTQIQTTKNSQVKDQNDYGYVKFSDLTFDKPGTYWFRIREDQTPIVSTVLDTSEYIMKVEISDPATKKDGAYYKQGDSDVPAGIVNDNANYPVGADGFYYTLDGKRIYRSTTTFYKVNNEAVYGISAEEEQEAAVATYQMVTSSSSAIIDSSSPVTFYFTGLPETERTYEWYVYIGFTEKITNSDAINCSAVLSDENVGATLIGGYTAADDYVAVCRINDQGGYKPNKGFKDGTATVTINYTGDKTLTIDKVQLYQTHTGGNTNESQYFTASSWSGGTTEPPAPEEPDEPSGEEPTPEPTIRPNLLPLVIPDGKGGYMVNPQALENYVYNEDEPLKYPAGLELDFHYHDFNNKTFNFGNDAAEVQLKFYKRIEGVDEGEAPKQFQFELYERTEDLDWNLIQTATNEKTGENDKEHDNVYKYPIYFAPIRYDTPGEYWYKVVETQTSNTGYVLDTTNYFVRVIVSESFDVTEESFKVETDEHGVGNIVVSGQTSVNLQKQYISGNDVDAVKEGEGFIKLPEPIDPNNANNAKIIIYFSSISGEGKNSATARLYIYDDSGNSVDMHFNNVGQTSAMEIDNNLAANQAFFKSADNNWHRFKLVMENFNVEGTKLTFAGMKYQPSSGADFVEAQFADHPDGSTDTTVTPDGTHTIYTTIFDKDGKAIPDALVAATDNNHRTFTNTKITYVEEPDPVAAQLKMLKHVNNRLYVNGAGDFQFELQTLEGEKWVNAGIPNTTNDNDGNVIFVGDAENEAHPLTFKASDIGTPRWFRVVEKVGDGNYIYSGEAYVFKVETLRSNGQLVTNVTTFQQPSSQDGVNMTAGLAGTYNAGDSMTASFTVPEQTDWNKGDGGFQLTINTGIANENYNTGSFDVTIGNSTYANDYPVNYNDQKIIWLTNDLTPGSQKVDLKLNSGGPIKVTSAYITYKDVNGAQQSLKLTPVNTCNANDGSNIIVNGTVDESLLTRTTTGNNVFHNTTRVDKPSETEINLHFYKYMNGLLYSGNSKFDFHLKKLDEQADGTYKVSNTEVVPVTQNSGHLITFDKIKYEGIGTHYYVAYEEPTNYNGDRADYKERYFTAEDSYVVKVVVSRNDGNLSAKAYYYRNPLEGQIKVGDFINIKDLGTALYEYETAVGEDGLAITSGTRPGFYNETTQNAELPSTGGAGTLLYTAGGLLLMAATLLYWYVTRRKRERRYE